MTLTFRAHKLIWVISVALVSVARGGQHISFQLDNIQLKVFAEGSVDPRPDGRYLHVAVVKDDAACGTCMIRSLEFSALVDAEGHSATMPIEIKKGDVSGHADMRIGSIRVTEFRLKLMHAEIVYPVPTKIYNGIVAEDNKCIRDAIDAMARGGGAGREALLPLVETGCIKITPSAMSAGMDAPSGLHVVHGKRVGYVYLLPLFPDDPHVILKGWILADKLSDGQKGEIVDLAGGSEVGPIPVTN